MSSKNKSPNAMASTPSAACDATTHAVSGSFSGHAKNSAGTVLTIEGGRFAQIVTASPAS